MTQILKKAASLLLKNPVLLLFGTCIALPKIAAQILLSRYDSLDQFLGTFSHTSPTPLSNTWIFGIFSGLIVALIIESIGIVRVITFVNVSERKHSSQQKETPAAWAKRANLVFRLEILFIVLLFIGEILLAIPSDIATSKGLANLGRNLFLSGFGLLASLMLLFFFLRQYAAIYLSVSLVSIRAALENSATLFRLHMRETFLLGTLLILWEFIVVFLLALIESIFNLVPAPHFIQSTLIWGTTILIFSALSAWNWISWTLLFRKIAVRKDINPALQNIETVIQKESASDLGEAHPSQISKEVSSKQGL